MIFYPAQDSVNSCEIEISAVKLQLLDPVGVRFLLLRRG